MELITDQELQAYTANSIIYEAPDYGVAAAAAVETKGAIRVRAAPRPQPPAPRLEDLVEAPEMSYARDVKVEIEVVSACKYPGGQIALTLKAKLTGFDPVSDSHFRWAYHSNNVKIVKDVAGDDQVTFRLPKEEEGERANIWVAASSKGLGVGNPNPFVQNPPEQFVGPMTFVTDGSAVAALTTYTVSAKGDCKAGDSYRLARIVILRHCFYVPCERREEVLEGPPGTIRHSVSRQMRYEEYTMEAVMSLDVPLTVIKGQPAQATASLGVTWDWRNLTDDPRYMEGRSLVDANLLNGGKLAKRALAPAGDYGSKMTDGRHSLSVGPLEATVDVGANQLTHRIEAQINSRANQHDYITVTVVYEPE